MIFNPWKVPWNWIVFYQNYFVISPGLLYHLIIHYSRRLANEASKQWLNGLQITNCLEGQRSKYLGMGVSVIYGSINDDLIWLMMFPVYALWGCRVACGHIVRLTMWHHLFLEFRLVNTWFFAHWRHQRAVIHLENVCQLNTRRGKKLGFHLPHR